MARCVEVKSSPSREAVMGQRSCNPTSALPLSDRPAALSMVPHVVLCDVPPKVRELEALLRKAGFRKHAAKGSHRKWVHPSGTLVVISGREGADAKKYQEQAVEEAIALAETKSET